MWRVENRSSSASRLFRASISRSRWAPTACSGCRPQASSTSTETTSFALSPMALPRGGRCAGSCAADHNTELSVGNRTTRRVAAAVPALGHPWPGRPKSALMVQGRPVPRTGGELPPEDAVESTAPSAHHRCATPGAGWPVALRRRSFPRGMATRCAAMQNLRRSATGHPLSAAGCSGGRLRW